jgi:hypothetical protein
MQHYISEPLFYACKHKYKSKQIKKQQKQVTNDLLLDQQGIPTTTTLSFLSFGRFYHSQAYSPFQSLGKLFVRFLAFLLMLQVNVFLISCHFLFSPFFLQEVDFIEKQVYDQFETTCSETKFNKSRDLHIIYFQEESKASSWRPKIKELPLRSIEFMPSSLLP